MLRSVVIAAFSAGLAVSAVSALDLGWNSAGAAEPVSVAAAPPDLGWNAAPTGAGK
ncbi:hypothetical protein ACIRF8_31230 [Streptomyces sp. NPDC102406]|uniref:hypothetical protein n=1 Tax=Streptomyces sp. NPDC102406 TaxID=3366171 RepID=UPI00382C9BD5